MAGTAGGLAVVEVVELNVTLFRTSYDFKGENVVGSGVVRYVVNSNGVLVDQNNGVGKDDASRTPCLAATEEQAGTDVVEVVLTAYFRCGP